MVAPFPSHAAEAGTAGAVASTGTARVEGPVRGERTQPRGAGREAGDVVPDTDDLGASPERLVSVGRPQIRPYRVAKTCEREHAGRSGPDRIGGATHLQHLHHHGERPAFHSIGRRRSPGAEPGCSSAHEEPRRQTVPRERTHRDQPGRRADQHHGLVPRESVGRERRVDSTADCQGRPRIDRVARVEN